MGDYKESSDTTFDDLNPVQGGNFENRLERDRRSESSEGFVYISSVGWIDRREKIRREDDPFDF